MKEYVEVAHTKEVSSQQLQWLRFSHEYGKARSRLITDSEHSCCVVVAVALLLHPPVYMQGVQLEEVSQPYQLAGMHAGVTFVTFKLREDFFFLGTFSTDQDFFVTQVSSDDGDGN